MSGLPVSAELVPQNGAPFGLFRDKNFIGGWGVCATLAERDGLDASKLVVGMERFVVETGKEYKLTASSPVTWVEKPAGGGPQLAFTNPDPAVTLDPLTWQVMLNEHNAAVAVTLPPPVLNRRIEIIDGIGKASSTAPITLDPGAGVDIDGDAELTIDLDWAWLTLIGDGTNWRTGT